MSNLSTFFIATALPPPSRYQKDSKSTTAGRFQCSGTNLMKNKGGNYHFQPSRRERLVSIKPSYLGVVMWTFSGWKVEIYVSICPVYRYNITVIKKRKNGGKKRINQKQKQHKRKETKTEVENRDTPKGGWWKALADKAGKVWTLAR